MANDKTKKNKIINALWGAKEAAGNYFDSAKNAVKTNFMQRKLADKMMDKEYVSSTMGESTWSKRRKETLALIKQGKMKQARTNLQSLKTQFKKDNPDYRYEK